MNIYWHELKSYRRSLLIWTFSLSLGAALFLSMFSAFTKDVAASQKILENLPLVVRQVLGISLSNFFTVFGFYSYFLTFISVAGAIQATNIGIGLLAKESGDKTVDFLLTKPVSRTSVVTQKALAGLTQTILTNICFILTSLIAAIVFTKEPFDVSTFLVLTSLLFFIQLIFLSLGLLLGATLPRVKLIISISLPTVFAFFIVGSVGDVINSTATRYLSPFKYVDHAFIIEHGHYQLGYTLLGVSIMILAIVATYFVFNYSDTRSVT